MRQNRCVRPSRPRVLSLYSGAGGLDFGFAGAGFKIAWANERDPHAVETYKRNLGDHIVLGDISTVDLPQGDFDVVIGGPPCQGWSRIGRMDPGDERSQHVHRFLDVVASKNPRAFVMENVAHLAEGRRWTSVRDGLLHRARNELHYSAEIFVLDASHFGVPQARRRMFLVGVQRGTPHSPRPINHRTPRTVRRALEALPALGQPGNDTVCAARIVPAKIPVMRASAYQGALLFNGSGRPLDLDRPARTLPASMGGNATPIVDQLELELGADPWVLDYHRHLVAGGAPHATAPNRLRRLSVEEAAALQSFPASYEFTGPKGSRYRQIGNSVPPALARAVARAVKRSLDEADDNPSHEAGPEQIAA